MCRPSWKGWGTRCSRPSPGSTSRPSSRSGCSVGLGVVAVLALVPAFWRRARGAPLRALVFALILLALANPRLVEETRETRPDIALLVIDRCDSARIGNRAAQVEAARVALEARLGRLPDLELRTVEVPEGGNQGTRLFTAMEQALAEIPRARLAGVIALTDGQVHDVPGACADRGALPRPAARPARRGRPAAPRHRGAGLRHRRPQRRTARRGRRPRRAERVPARRRTPVHPPRRLAAAHRERARRPRAPHRDPHRARRPDRGRARRRGAAGRGLRPQQPRRRHASPACATGCACCW